VAANLGRGPQAFVLDAAATPGKPSLVNSNTISLNPAPAGFGLKLRHCLYGLSLYN
jgi:hypothetical protein